MNFIGIIPARYGSTRFPGKPLAIINGKTMIQRVFEQSKKALDNVVVATDDERIKQEVERFGGVVVMTSQNHKTGTDRCAEAVKIYSAKTNEKFDVVINIQGDEPYISPHAISQLVHCFVAPDTQIATLVNKENNIENIKSQNIVKVIINKKNEAIYFSRSIIPFVRNADEQNFTELHQYYKHIGIYAYKTNILHKITPLHQSSLEIAESLEQNRWLENCYKIKIAVTEYETSAVDTKEDLEKLKNRS